MKCCLCGKELEFGSIARIIDSEGAKHYCHPSLSEGDTCYTKALKSDDNNWLIDSIMED